MYKWFWTIFSLGAPDKSSAFNVSSRVTLLSITDELAIMVFVELLYSPPSDVGDFETPLVSSLVVAGCWEELPRKTETLADDLFWHVGVWCFSFQVTSERRLCHALLEMSTSFMHTMHRALCLSPLTSRSHSLYSGSWSHKLLKTHFPIVVNLLIVKQ